MPSGRRPSGGPVRHMNPIHRFEEVPNVEYNGPIPVDPSPRWPLATQRWWSFVSKMPHCVLWGDTDWQYAWDTADVHAQWLETRKVLLLSELRQREAKMGTTHDSRLAIRVRWVNVDDNADGENATVTQIRKIGG